MKSRTEGQSIPFRNNKLYREAIEDYGFANAQAALRVAQLRQELEIVETILTVGKKTP